MSVFSSFFPWGDRGNETPPPLPPRPRAKTTSPKASPDNDVSSSNPKRSLVGDIEGRWETHTFASLCERFEQQQVDLQSLRTAHDEAVSTIEKLQSQLTKSIEERQQCVELKDSQILALSAQIKDLTGQTKELRAKKDQAVACLQAELRNQRKNFANKEKEQSTKEQKLSDQIQASSKALTRANQALEEQRVLCEQLAQRAEESQRLPRGILQSTFAARFVQPFVMVLIDGDAYKFTHELTGDHRSGGARAAHRIKVEVMNYLTTHREIPLHSKIVVRIFFNASSQRGKLGKDGLRGTPAFHTFMIQFSETHPLFDFLDCGRGRERADSKIKQNFELFIDNPYCRAMFLAVCYDGGFVRMLEPYQYSEDAVSKIVLIKAGQVAPAFTSVPLFKFTEFKSVFQELCSLKIGPIGNPMCTTDDLKPTSVQLGETLCTGDDGEVDDLPIEDVPYNQWKHATPHVHPATTLSIFCETTLPTPWLIALGILPFQLRGSNDSTNASVAAMGKRRTKWRIQALEMAIAQKKQAALQPGTSSTLQEILRLTARSLEGDLARLKREVEQRTKKQLAGDTNAQARARGSK